MSTKNNNNYSTINAIISSPLDKALQTQYITNSIELHNAISTLLDSFKSITIVHKIKGEEVSICIATLLDYATRNGITYTTVLNRKEFDTSLGYKWSFASGMLNKDKYAVILQAFPNDLQDTNSLVHATISATIQFIDYILGLWLWDNYQQQFKDNATEGRKLNKKFAQTAFCLGFKCNEKDNTLHLTQKQVKEYEKIIGKLYEMIKFEDLPQREQKEKKVFAYICPTCGHVHLKGVNQKKDTIACAKCAENGVITIINGAKELPKEQTEENEG